MTAPPKLDRAHLRRLCEAAPKGPYKADIDFGGEWTGKLYLEEADAVPMYDDLPERVTPLILWLVAAANASPALDAALYVLVTALNVAWLILLIAIFAGCQAAGPYTVREVCEQVGEAGCARAVECGLTDQQHACDCAAFVSRCCAGSTCERNAYSISEADVAACVAAYADFQCSLVTPDFPPECRALERR